MIIAVPASGLTAIASGTTTTELNNFTIGIKIAGKTPRRVAVDEVGVTLADFTIR
jgi:hypothetical protein